MMNNVRVKKVAGLNVAGALCACVAVFAIFFSPAVGAVEAPIPIFTQSVGGGAPPLTVTFDPSLSYIPVASPGNLFIYTAIWDFGDDTGLYYVGPTFDRNALLAPVTHAYIAEQLYTVTLKIIIDVVHTEPSTSRPMVQAFVRFTNAKDGMTNICIPYPGAYTLVSNQIVLSKPVPRPLSVTVVGPVTGVVETFSYNPADTTKYSYIFSRFNPDSPGDQMNDALYRGTFNPTGENYPPPPPVAVPTEPTPFYPLISGTATLPTDRYLLDPKSLALLTLPFEPLPLVCYGTGNSGFTSSLLHVVTVNHEPDMKATLSSATPNIGLAPHTVTIDPSEAWDEDGYFIWGAIDWGDGSSELIPILPPYKPARTYSHTYFLPGVYKITISGIDNGRIPVPAVLNPFIAAGTVPALPTPDCWDPAAALKAYTDYQENFLRPNGIVVTPALPLTEKQQAPRLRQDFIFISVLGNASLTKGSFGLDFNRAGNDAVSIQFIPNTLPAGSALSSSPMTLTIGTVVFSFTTDHRARYRDSNLRFDYNAKKKTIRFQAKRQDLATTWLPLYSIPSGMDVAAGNADIPFVLKFKTGETISGVIRFSYSVRAGKRAKSLTARTLQ